MPIIDPSLAFSFLNSFEKADSQLAKNFFPYFLAIASKQKINNLYATKAYIRFKKHVSGYSNFFSSKQIYDFNLSSDFISQIAKKNLYELLIENINLDTNNLDLKGSYKIYDQFDMKFFQPYVLFPSNHNWLLTTNPIAILCINTYELENNELFFQLINLEIDLMAASGYTLVLCIDYEKNISIEENISDIINQHPFAEIHFNIYPKNNKLLEECNGNFHESTLNFILNIFKDQKIDGYFYLYSSFDGLNNQSDVILKTLHLNYHNFDNLSFNKHPLDSLKNISLRHIKPFLYCENGFDFDEIQLILYNVPIYNEIDEENDLTPFNVSSIKMVYISKKDFINNWDQKRKMIFINDETKNNSLSIKYVDFDDIHIIKPNLIVKNTFYLSNAIPASFVDDIDEIIDYIEDQKNVDYKEGFKDQFLALFNTITEEKLISCLSLVSSLYTKILSENLKCEFKLRKSQLIAVLFSCAEVLNIVDKNKGFAFQVSTGEGKSCIIHLIAAIFSLLKKKVHIVSSNILLSLRDYQFSYNFFKELKITSAIFLHKNERPFKNYNTLNEKTKEFFPSTYFSDDKFDNSSSMNYCSCDMKKGAQIIFSTFVNFECYYLRMVETSPDDIKKYYKNTFLIVDEADSILIDEINNGTILSHPMKTNVEEVLTYIYTKKKKNIDPSQILLKVKEKWPDCQDMTISDIKYMFHEIDLVNSDEFQNGLKYYIEPTKSINEKKVDEVIEFYKDLIGDDDKLKNEILSINQNDQQFDKNNNKKQIIPFDYDHKGILEPNKEFSGFVQQFIAIKEKLSTKEDINVKELSMNYLYVSHPTFIKNYENVLCFTGTIGNDKDKHVFITQYDLIPIDIPKENADLRVDFPIIICKTITERNNKIFEEMMNFHQRDYPVLIIFNDMIEIGTFCSLLETKKVKRYNIFDGSEEKIKPDFIAGIKGQISLGTNFCGRGTDIKIYDKPLHVIVSYYTNNERVMEQALGRTARQGSKGTTRIICIEKDFLAATRELDENEMNETLNEFLIKNKIQTEFIEKYKKNRRWIFDNKIDEQIISSACLSKMREARINVNRKTAYEFTYPICMSVDTFLDIQAQKIFSLYNCPNCKYTWLIFRKYIREMIFESYSITMNKVDKLYYLREGVEGKSYEDFLRENINDLYKKLEEYLPSSSNIFDNKILPTFMNIFNICLKKHENYILDFYPNSLTNIMSKSEFKYVSFFFGFKPFTLMNKSGAKINSVNGENQEMNYIEDPELKYYQMNIFKNKISISITKKIDQIFNELCNRINETINSFIGLNFFLRRTLGGCEFGVCFNMNSIQLGSNKNDYKLLVDKNPLLLFTIYVKSINPILAGILIFGLIYIASISKTISEFIKVFKGGKAIKDTLKSLVLLLLKSDDDNDNLFTKSIDFVFEKIESFLNEKIESQIKQITDESTQQIFIILKDIFDNNDFNEVTSKINKLFQDKFLFSMEDMSVSDVLPMKKFFRLGILLLLCFSSFMINFNSCHKSLSYNPEKVAIEYNDQQNLEKSINDNSYLSQNDIIQYNENGKEISLDDSSFWILEIDIIEAIDIPKMDVIGWADPYVTFFFSSDPKTIHKTDFIPDSKNPKWNASFKMTINNNKDEKIIFHLMDRDQGFITDDLISYIDIHIKNLPLERKMQKWYDMIPSAKAKKGAKLHLSFNIHT